MVTASVTIIRKPIKTGPAAIATETSDMADGLWTKTVMASVTILQAMEADLAEDADVAETWPNLHQTGMI